jgi:hypothetical protein
VPRNSARGAYRTRAGQRREPRVRVWLTPAEWDTVTAAAARAGMAPGAYAAQALLDVAERRTVNLSQLRREMVVALMQAAAHVSSISTSLDQAVAQMKASGTPGPELEPAARQGARVIRTVEEAAQLVRRRL